MNYPNITQYKESIQDSDSFNSLNEGIHPTILGYEPVFASGNFATVFKMEYQGATHALKCFLKELPDRRKKQAEIVNYLKNNPSKFFVEYHFLEDELWVDIDGGNDYPVTWMEWVDAPTLGETIKHYCDNNDENGLKQLTDKFREFAIWILNEPFAHTDLKHDNILVRKGSKLVLVDYDGMFVPSFKNIETNELGGKSYQHPNRNSKHFNRNTDDFSILIIYISLLALTYNPKLYSKYNNGQNIIFDSKDFINIKKSDVYKDINRTPQIDNLIDVLILSLSKKTILIAGLKEKIITDYTNFNTNKIINDINEGYFNLIDHLNKTSKDIDAQVLIEQQQALLMDIKSSMIIDSSKNTESITATWWNGLSKEWKYLLLFNIDFVSKIGNEPIYSWKSNIERYENLVGYKYVENTNHSIDFVINELKSIERFTIDKTNIKIIKNLTPLSKLSNLKDLSIVDNHYNLSPLSYLKKLKKLHLDRNIAELVPLSLLASLRELDLPVNKANLDPISKLIKLESLNLWDNSADLSSIPTLINLRKLTLWSNTSSLLPLKELKNIIEKNKGRVKGWNDSLC